MSWQCSKQLNDLWSARDRISHFESYDRDQFYVAIPAFAHRNWRNTRSTFISHQILKPGASKVSYYDLGPVSSVTIRRRVVSTEVSICIWWEYFCAETSATEIRNFICLTWTLAPILRSVAYRLYVTFKQNNVATKEMRGGRGLTGESPVFHVPYAKSWYSLRLPGSSTCHAPIRVPIAHSVRSLWHCIAGLHTTEFFFK
jgi:hypothetical protein